MLMTLRHRRPAGSPRETDLADRGGINVDVDDLRVRGEVLGVAGDAVIEAGPDGDQAVTVLHGVVGDGVPCMPSMPQRQLIGLVHRAQAEQRRGHGDLELGDSSRQTARHRRR